MRHHDKNRKFGRERNQRKALMRSLVVGLVSSEKVKTTEAKAKELRPLVEKLVTKAKIGTLHQKKLLVSKIGAESAKKLIEKIAPKYAERKGGYTRIIKTPQRKSDGSAMAIIEFV
ncbi:MAG: 50S ribosomal protein L17 [Candidatus Pacebacteria bacterium]|nr:50S ribosomal protein L17 [Candidatus Paceibacterota bacterium]NUQ57474.1 50S ribosomal protein L17 [Candidatus Paceibacter sp.]